MTILLTAAYALSVPTIGKQAFFNNPILAVNLFTLVTYALVQRWRRYAGEVCVLFLHMVFKAVAIIQQIKENYFSTSESANDMHRRRNRKLVRCAIFFIMAQTCLTPRSHFTWAHSLLTFKFLLDIVTFTKKEIKKRQERASERGDDHPPPPTDTAPPPVIVTATDTPPGESPHFRNGIQIFKATFACMVLCYQAVYMNYLYLLSTLLYFILVQHYLHRPVTYLLEQCNLDCLEGLEKYYVSGLLGVAEVFFALYFMIWSLMGGQQLLMLVGLYTNVYASSRDILHNALRAAFAEWTLLARFERATREELKRLDDVCAVCLSPMSTARKTPCQHFFHGHCLRQCIKEKPLCPICAKKLFGL